MSIFLLINFLLFVLSSQANTIKLSHINTLKQLAYSKMWLKLNHYKETQFSINFTTNYKSTIDDPNFFLAHNGRFDPLQELIASIKIIGKNQKNIGFYKQNARCAYPARTNFLIKKKLISSKKYHNCVEFKRWFKAIGDDSISLIFSSYFPNSPPSMFGHTFLRFNTKNRHTSDLLDYSVTYEANIPYETPSISYTIKGLFGGFKGHLNVRPYYQNVNKYLNFENRDIYEYNLKISKKQVKIIKSHIWELYSNASSSYYFLTRNCTYFIAEILEVGLLNSNLSRSKLLYYQPSQLMKYLKQKNLITSISYKPSLKKKLQFELKNLKLKERKDLNLIINKKINLKSIKDIATIDALVSSLNYLKHKKKLHLSTLDNRLYQKSLRYRSTLGMRKRPIDYSKIKRSFPEKSRDLSKISLGTMSKKDIILSFEYAICSVDFNGSSIGLPQNTILKALDINLILEKKIILLNNIIFLEMQSLSPISYIETPLSWNIEINSQKDDFDNKYYFYMFGGAGITLGNNKNFFSLTSGPYLKFNPKFSQKNIQNIQNIIAVNLKTLLHLTFQKKIHSTLESKYIVYQNTQNLNFKYDVSYTLNVNNNIQFDLISNTLIKEKENKTSYTLKFNHHF